MEIWENFYDGIYSQRVYVDIQFTDVKHPFLDSVITSEEIYHVLNKCKSRKAPGNDLISYEFLKNVPHNWILYLNVLFNNIFQTALMPLQWTEILLTMVHKGGLACEPSNYRGLALANCTGKVFTSILYNRLTQWSEECHILPEAQAGFRSGRGCIDNVYTLNSIVNLHIRLKKRKYLLFS